MTAEPCLASSFGSPLLDRSGQAQEISGLVDAIGSRVFNSILFETLQERMAVEHFTLYRFDQHGFDICCAASSDGSDTALDRCRRYVEAGYWRRDPAIAKAQSLPVIKVPVFFRVNASLIADAAYRDEMYIHEGITERVVICADRPNGRFGLSVVRTRAGGRGFCDGELAALGEIADVILSVAAKHVVFGSGEPSRLLTSFSSVAEIEAGLGGGSWDLTMRERQVCARILYGLSIHGISLDLGVGEETIATYRKRAYRRLNIGSRHELLRLYISKVNPAALEGARYFDARAMSLERGTDTHCTCP